MPTRACRTECVMKRQESPRLSPPNRQMVRDGIFQQLKNQQALHEICMRIQNADIANYLDEFEQMQPFLAAAVRPLW